MNIGMRLTRAGKLVLAKGLIGKEIHFTKVALGDGAFDYDVESVFDLEGLRNWRMDLPLTAKEIRGDGTVYVEAFLSNAEVAEGFACREHGLFALDPDSGDEILYAYRNAGNDYDFIPANTGPAHKNIYLEYIAEIQDAENVTATLDLSVAYINKETFESHVNSAHPHLNTPNHYDDVTETEKLWATDNDNHLHQISLANLKEQLADEIAAPVESAQNIIDKAKAELGLDANLMLIENLDAPEDIDTLKIKVTSSAENGSLLGVESIDQLKTGYQYIISDGINQEVIQISSVIFNISGHHARLKSRLSFAYDINQTYLYRTAYSGAFQRYLNWNPDLFFSGVEANISRTINLDTSDFDIEGDGIFIDGYFSLR